jgi:hypothetical protein
MQPPEAPIALQPLAPIQTPCYPVEFTCVHVKTRPAAPSATIDTLPIEITLRVHDYATVGLAR